MGLVIASTCMKNYSFVAFWVKTKTGIAVWHFGLGASLLHPGASPRLHAVHERLGLGLFICFCANGSGLGCEWSGTRIRLLGLPGDDRCLDMNRSKA